MKHLSIPSTAIYSFENRSEKMPAAPNISKINQQYHIKLKTDERLKNWRQSYDEFPMLSSLCKAIISH